MLCKAAAAAAAAGLEAVAVRCAAVVAAAGVEAAAAVAAAAAAGVEAVAVRCTAAAAALLLLQVWNGRRSHFANGRNRPRRGKRRWCARLQLLLLVLRMLLLLQLWKLQTAVPGGRACISLGGNSRCPFLLRELPLGVIALPFRCRSVLCNRGYRVYPSLVRGGVLRARVTRSAWVGARVLLCPGGGSFQARHRLPFECLTQKGRRYLVASVRAAPRQTGVLPHHYALLFVDAPSFVRR